MLSVNVKITGTEEELAKFKKLGDKLTDFSDAMKQIGTELTGYYGSRSGTPGQVFGSEGGILGERWSELSPVYRSWKGKHYPGKGILVASGTLMNSFRATSTKTSVLIDNPTPYFNYLQSGTNRMRPRPMLSINKDVEDIVQNIIEDDVSDKVKNL